MSKDERIKYELSSHNPPDTILLTSTEAGPLYRIPIHKLVNSDPSTIRIPDYIQKVVRTPRNRSRFMHTMNWNSRIGPRWLGKPNSAFFLCKEDKNYLDYLEEDPNFERGNNNVLHDIMREHVDYSKSTCIYGRVTALSGHFAPLNITEKFISHIMTFDAFSGPDAYRQMHNNMQKRVRQLYESRILPFTQDGFIIQVRNFY